MKTPLEEGPIHPLYTDSKTKSHITSETSKYQRNECNYTPLDKEHELLINHKMIEDMYQKEREITGASQMNNCDCSVSKT